MFLRNAWYVAAISGEIGRELHALRILGDDIVFYRMSDGSPVALENACPHRKLPLSKGRLEGDSIACGYHGLTFDCTGNCIKSPTQERLPPSARVHSYPVADRWGLTWIWMGDPGRADENDIFHIENFDDPAWCITTGDSLTCACNYLYLTDNLLDPSHVAWVHQSSFAAAGTDNAPLDVEPREDGMIVSRWVYDQEPPPFYTPLLRFSGTCDRLQYYEVRYPSIAINKSIFTPAGTGGPNLDVQPDTYVMISYNFLTPIDENTTRYHWLQHRNTDPQSEEITLAIAAGARAAFEEDREILEAVHKGMSDKRTPNIDLGLDAAALHFRRELEKMIVDEAR